MKFLFVLVIIYIICFKKTTMADTPCIRKICHDYVDKDDEYLILEDGRKIFTEYKKNDDAPNLINYVKSIPDNGERKLFAGLYLACFMKHNGIPPCDDIYLSLASHLSLIDYDSKGTHLDFIQEFYPDQVFQVMFTNKLCMFKNLWRDEYIYFEDYPFVMYTGITNVGGGTLLQVFPTEDQFISNIYAYPDGRCLVSTDNNLIGSTFTSCPNSGKFVFHFLEDCSYFQLTYESKLLTSIDQFHGGSDDMHELGFLDAFNDSRNITKWMVECKK